MNPAALNGLDLLATAVVVVDDNQVVLYMNPAAENLFEASHTSATGLTLERLLGENAVLSAAISYSRANHSSYTEHEIEIAANGRQRLNLAMKSRTRWGAYVARHNCSTARLKGRACTNTRRSLSRNRIGCRR